MKFFILGLIVCCFVIQSTNGFSSGLLIAITNAASPNFCPCIDDLICIPLNGSLNFDFCVNVKNISNCNGLIHGFTECETCTNNGLTFCPGSAGFTNAALPFSGGTCTNNALLTCAWLPSQNDTITSPTECPASVCKTLDCIPSNECFGEVPLCFLPEANNCDDCDPCTLDFCDVLDPTNCICAFFPIIPPPPGCPSITTGTTGTTGITGTTGTTETTGTCPADDDDDDDGNGEKITICHKPETNAEHTIEVDTSAVPAHLGHGDSMGSCESAQSARAFNSYVRSGVSSARLLLFNFIYMMCAVAVTAAV